MAENRDLGRAPPNITSSGSLEMVGLSTMIQEQLLLTLVFTHGQLRYDKKAKNPEMSNAPYL